MTDSYPFDLEALTPEALNAVDSVCDDFERAWRDGKTPKLEEFLERAPVDLRKLLLHELLAIELPYRREVGESTATDDYAARFAELDIQRFRRIRAKSLSDRSDGTLPNRRYALDDPRSENAIIGDYRLIREVGRGGMGIVFAAEQLSLGRQVALKILPASQLIRTRHIQRFQNEARAAASLQHPNIVPVYSVGSENDVHFYVMQLIHGKTLEYFDRSSSPSTDSNDAVSTDGKWGSITSITSTASKTIVDFPDRVRRIAKLGIQAAEALEHAHSMGIVHRDIKPSNLLVDDSEKLWVTDFGLARFAADGNLTASGDLLGTLRFMSPEQALAKHGLVDHRTDIYSLGVTLYEVLVGKPAFAGKDRVEILRQIAFEEPTPLRKICAEVPRDFETIVAKAMAKEPSGRYQSAEELAADLRRFVEDRPVLAKRRTKFDELIRWTRRNRALSAAFATTLAVILAANFAVAWLWSLERKALQETKHAQQETLRQSRELERSVYLQRIALAEQELVYSSIGRAEQALDRCPPELRHWEWAYLKRACNIFTREYRHPAAEATCVRYAPNGDRIAVGYSDGNVRLWEIASGEFRLLEGHSASVLTCAFSPDGRMLATSSGDYVAKKRGEVMLWKLNEETIPISFENEQSFASSIDFSPDGMTLVVAQWNKSLRLIDTRTGASQYRKTDHSSALKAVRVSSDGQTIASGDWSGTVLLSEFGSGKTIRRLQGHTGDVVQLAFDAAGKELVSSSWDSSAILWDLNGAKLHTFLNAETLQRFGGKNNTVWTTSLSPNGAWVATGSEDGAVRLWNTKTGLAQALPRGHTGAVKGVDFSPDGKELASVGLDGSLRLWDANQTDFGRVLPVQVGVYRRIEFSPDGLQIAAASGPVPIRDLPGRLFLMDATGRNKPILTAERPEGFRSPAFDATTQQLVADFGSDVGVWDATSGEHLRVLKGDKSIITSVAILPHGIVIASDNEGIVRTWSIETGQRTNLIRTPLKNIERLVTNWGGNDWAAISTDGRVVIGKKASNGGWSNCLLPREKTTLGAADGAAPRVALSSATGRLAIGLDSGTIELWDLAKMRLAQTLPGHPGSTMSLAFSSDGLRLAAGGKDGTIILWDTASGQEAMVLRKQLRNVACVAFSPDGQSLAAMEELAEKVTLWSVEK